MGRVRSLDRVIPHWKYGKQRLKGCVLQPGSTSNGYHQVVLCKDDEKKTVTVHRLVLDAFVPRVKGKNVCNHKNGDRTDNRIKNLEWGRRCSTMAVRCIKTKRKFETVDEAARACGISNVSVYSSVYENRAVLGKYKFVEVK